MRRIRSTSDGLINEEDRTDRIDREIDVSSDGWNFSRQNSTRSWLDRHAIMAQLSCDRGSFMGDRGTQSPHAGDHDRRAIVATNRHPIADQTAQIFLAKISLITDVLPLIL